MVERLTESCGGILTWTRLGAPWLVPKAVRSDDKVPPGTRQSWVRGLLGPAAASPARIQDGPCPRQLGVRGDKIELP